MHKLAIPKQTKYGVITTITEITPTTIHLKVNVTESSAVYCGAWRIDETAQTAFNTAKENRIARFLL